VQAAELGPAWPAEPELELQPAELSSLQVPAAELEPVWPLEQELELVVLSPLQQVAVEPELASLLVALPLVVRVCLCSFPAAELVLSVLGLVWIGKPLRDGPARGNRACSVGQHYGSR